MAMWSANTGYHADLFRMFTGALCTIVIVLTLQMCIGIYQIATYSTFSSVEFVSAITGFAVFSKENWVNPLFGDRLLYSVSSILRRWILVFFVILLGAYLTKTAEELSRVVMIAWFFSAPIFLVITISLLRKITKYVYATQGQQRTAIFIGLGDASKELVKRFDHLKFLGVKPIGYFDDAIISKAESSHLLYLGRLSQSTNWINRHSADMVFISLELADRPEVIRLVNTLYDSVASVYFVPESSLFGLRDIQVSQVGEMPVLVAAETPFIGLSRLIKRLFDIFISSIALGILFPVMALIAVSIYTTSPGKVLFKQRRYGFAGKEFMVYKFRSMRENTTQDDIRQASRDDERITSVGRFLRRTSLDELPQLLNVLEGSMSIVGPRPHAVGHNELYRKQIKGYMLRHKVKPGITGWAQINGLRGKTDTVEKMKQRVEHDLYYINHWSVWFDLIIILKTFALVFRDKHAY
jgi:putative colanic acid biosysnthesis UDP-glucose lipid carrier transferase